jgi:RNA polymerase sigma factor (sigma-70 family)
VALQRDYYSRSPEVLLVGLARRGDRNAFEEIVRRRQTWIRSLMRRCCGNATLADDLAQRVFLQAWRSIPQVQQPGRFGGWLKQLAINVWRQDLRRKDPLRNAEQRDEIAPLYEDLTAVALDLDRALAELADDARLCIVLSYHEGMTHDEISDLTSLPPGTVKSHIRRGTQRLQKLLSGYFDSSASKEGS